MRELPSGTVTFLFTDIEGSTRLSQELGDGYAGALGEHRRALRDAFARHHGVEVDTQGDAFFVAFSRASDALAAARSAQAALRGPIRVRIGVHTGEPLVTGEGYVGIDVHRAARIAAAGHGGQVLVSQSTRDLVGGGGLRDLGEHRLKDLTAPERVYQLGSGEFPPLKSLNQTNLPIQPAPLVGRKHELTEISDLLQSSRLLTLTGAGGSGKTRLALQAAADVVDEFPQGVWFVSLASLTDPELIEPTIGQIVGASDDLAAFLRAKKLLLLLDNLEQLLPEVAPWIAQLEAHVLATSRERLNIGGEQEYPVPPLPLDDAVTLFMQRARQLRPAFQLDEHVPEIARRLDGLPLALELAAARIKVLTTQQIRERLAHSLDLLTSGTRDAPERQRTLRGTIEWSYGLLDKDEKALFGSLGVFAGSFDLEAAEAVVAADLDRLQSLVDKSLLRQTGEGRFFLLETIWEYARELFTSGSAADTSKQRHAAYFARLVDVRSKAVMDGDPVATAEVAACYADIRAALQFALDEGDFSTAVVIADKMWFFWISRGLNREGYDWIRRIEAERGALSVEDHLRFVGAAGELARFAGDPERAIAWKTEEAKLAGQRGDAPMRAAVLADLAHIFAERFEFERAEDVAREALAIRREIGEPGGIAHAQGGLGHILLVQQNYSAARQVFESAFELFQKADWKLFVVDTHLLIAACLRREGMMEEAIVHLRDALALALEHERWTDAPEILGEVAEVLLARSDPVRASVLTGAAEKFVEDFGRPSEVTFGNPNVRADTIRAAIGSDAYERAALRGAGLDLRGAFEEALAALD